MRQNGSSFPKLKCTSWPSALLATHITPGRARLAERREVDALMNNTTCHRSEALSKEQPQPARRYEYSETFTTWFCQDPSHCLRD